MPYLKVSDFLKQRLTPDHPHLSKKKKLLTNAIRDFPRDVKQLNESIHILLDKHASFLMISRQSQSQ